MNKIIETYPIPCPVCRSNNFENIYTKEFNVYINDNLKFIWPTNQVICKKCGMIYTNPQPTQNILETYYKSYSRYGDTFRTFKFKKAQVEFLKENIPDTSKTVLEIGAFDGTLLHFLKEYGFKVYGIEPSEEGVKNAFKKYGIKLEHAFFDDAYVKDFLKDSRDKFDVVLFLHVFEHVPNPIKFLKLVQKITKEGGLIFIEVPDTERPIVKNIADFFSIEHLMYYTKASLKNIAYILDMEILTIERPVEAPVIRIILKNIKNTGKKENKPKFINELEKKKKIIEDYKNKRNEFINTLKAKLDGIKHIIIYGAGMHTSQVFSENLLNNITVEAIVDSDPKKWGINFFGYTVQPPTSLKQTNTPVLISSCPSQEEISNFLTKNYPHIKQIKLY